MSPLTLQSLAAETPLTEPMHVRFTAEQMRLIREVSRGYRRPMGTVVRDIVVAWAANVANAEAELNGEPRAIDLTALVADLHHLADIEAE